MGNWCPRIRKACRKDCVHYRFGIREYDSGPKAGQKEAVEDCAFNIGVDCLENLVGRSIGNQKATEQTRNEVSKLNNLLYGMAERKALEQ